MFGWLKKQFGASESTDDGCCAGHPEVKFRQGAARFEEFIVRQELEQGGNLEHGAFHLSNLLSLDPRREDWIDLAEQYYVRCESDLEVLKPKPNSQDGETMLAYSQAAYQAWLDHRTGDLDSALRLLVSVTRARPDTAYLEAWGLDWLEVDNAWARIDANQQLSFLAAALNRFSEYRELTQERRRDASRYARLAETVKSDSETEAMVSMFRGGFYRKAGMFEEGLKYLREFRRDEIDDWHSAVAEGLMLRQMGETELAERAFVDAIAFDPDDRAARLEAADTYFEARDWDQAAQWYQTVLDLEPDHAWAYPSFWWCRWKEDQLNEGLDAEFPAPLDDLLKSGEPNQRVSQLWSEFRAFDAYLPEPSDATANMIPKIVVAMQESDPTEQDDPSEVDVNVNWLEAPSNFLAFDLAMQSIDRKCKLKVDYEAIQTPDPREAAVDVRWQLWKYDGTHAHPNLAKPSTEITEHVRYVAARPFNFATGWALASEQASKLNDDAIVPLLASIVHPPAVPTGWTATKWVCQFQHAAVWIIAHIGECTGQRWMDSDRREALRSLVLGPLDWSIEPAIISLRQLATENESLAEDIGEMFQRRSETIPSSGYVCYEATLYSQWQDLPHLFEDERAELAKKLQAIEDAQ